MPRYPPRHIPRHASPDQIPNCRTTEVMQQHRYISRFAYGGPSGAKFLNPTSIRPCKDRIIAHTPPTAGRRPQSLRRRFQDEECAICFGSKVPSLACISGHGARCVVGDGHNVVRRYLCGNASQTLQRTGASAVQAAHDLHNGLPEPSSPGHSVGSQS
jgi:hypothetical protein